MIYSDGYCLIYYPKRNVIEIVMPQTMTALTNTVAMISNRNTVLTEAEEIAILSLEVLADAFPEPNMAFDKWKRENDDLKSEITTLKETIVRIMQRYVDVL